MDILNTAITIRDSVRDIPKQYKYNCERIKQLENEQTDLLHLLELRQERRKIKDENEQLKHLEPILSKWQCKLSKLDGAIGAIRKAEANKTNRKYYCRVRKDLEPKINKI